MKLSRQKVMAGAIFAGELVALACVACIIVAGCMAVLIFLTMINEPACGCGDLPRPYFSGYWLENATGNYLIVHYEKPGGYSEIKDLKVTFTGPNGTITRYCNSTLLPGSSYAFRANSRQDGNYIRATVTADGNEFIVLD